MHLQWCMLVQHVQGNGNASLHGQRIVVYAALKRNTCSILCSHMPIRPLIYLPENVNALKAQKLRDQGAEICFFGTDCLEAELEARKVACEKGLTYVSPYNDLQVCDTYTMLHCKQSWIACSMMG